MGNNCIKGTGEFVGEANLANKVKQLDDDYSLKQHSIRKEQSLDWNELIKHNNDFLYQDMKKGLEEEPKRFLLNNIALSVQFFKNYEIDKPEAQKQRELLKSDLDSKLKDVKKNCLIPGTIFERVNEYVSFRKWEVEGGREGGRLKKVLHPLITEEVVLCYTNIEIDSQSSGPHVDGEDSMQYTSLNDRTYRGALEGASPNGPYQGYVKIRIDEPKEGISTSEDNSEEKSDIQEESTPIPPPLPTPPPIKTSTPFLEDVAEGDEEEEEEDDMEAFKSKVMLGLDNYVNPPRKQFGPSTNQIAREMGVKPVIPDLAPMNPGTRQGRRDSGVFHESHFKLIAKQQEIKQMLQKQKSVISESGQDSNTLVPTKMPNKNDMDGIYVESRRKPLEDVDTNKEETRSSRGSIIPSTCFEKRDKLDMDEENDEDNTNDRIDDSEQFLYLSSRGMMKYFQQQFPSICDRLGKPELKSGSNSSVLPPDIFCKETEQVGPDSYEETHIKFTPSIECAEMDNLMKVGWTFRKPTKMKDRRTNIMYEWPDEAQRDAVTKLGCNIVPVGFTYARRDKQKENTDFSIQWQIRFVKAETYLTKHLHYPKIKVYFLLLVLYKKYMENLEGITEEHLKHIFYSKIEKCPTNWTEENAGEKLLDVLRTLFDCLKTKKITNFFINKCNMLEGMADHKIFNVQHQVYRILENPVNHLLAALHDIQYEKNFYPEFDSQTFKLYEMLTKDKTEVFEDLFGVSSSKQTHNSEYMGNVTLNNISDDSLDVNSKGKDKYQRKMTKIRLEEESKKQKENEERRRLEEEANKNSTDHWLEGDWIIDKDETRWKNIITFFLEHFLNMAEKSNTHRNHGQAYMYFQQAKNLYRRLDEEGFAGDGSKYSPLKIRLDTLENNLTDLNKRDYFNIGFSHPQLVRTASFRSEQRVSIPLPSPPSEESSPIPGTKRPDEKSLAKELENIQQKLDEKKKAKEQNTIEGLGWIKEAQNGISESKDESSEDSVKQQVKVTIHNVETEESDDFEIYKL